MDTLRSPGHHFTSHKLHNERDREANRPPSNQSAVIMYIMMTSTIKTTTKIEFIAVKVF